MIYYSYSLASHLGLAWEMVHLQRAQGALVSKNEGWIFGKALVVPKVMVLGHILQGQCYSVAGKGNQR